MDAQEILFGLLVSAILGVFGQGLRAVSGLKKQSDSAADSGKKLGEVFDKTSFYFSLFTGAMAGIAAYLGMKYGSAGGVDFKQGTSALGIVAAGYAGADFIEGFAKKYLPK